MFSHDEIKSVDDSHMDSGHMEKKSFHVVDGLPVKLGSKTNLDSCVDLILYAEKSPQTYTRKRPLPEDSKPEKDDDDKSKDKKDKKDPPKSPVMKSKSVSKDNFFLFWN